ncbi:MAG: DUF1178 domain-containing protein [Syntrophus sp. (in: bacteria)]|nr:DUF1178 domain-containing protein [Syntrophus sp. (in: bacteria)]
MVHLYFLSRIKKFSEAHTPVIIYDLKCKKNHQFEGWFKDRAAFEQQKDRNLITCPVCGEAGAEMVPSTLAILSRDSKASEIKQNSVPNPMKMMQQLKEFLEKNFDDVGDTFSEVAMKIHDGEEDARNIQGTTTRQEEELLREKGIPFFKIPVMKLDS